MCYLLAVLSISVVLLSIIPQSNATHFYGGHKWSNPMTPYTNNAGPFCIGSSIGNQNMGFDAGVNAFTTAASSINGLPSKWTIGPRMTWTSSCHSHIAAGTFKNPDTLANVGLLLDSNNHARIVGGDITISKTKTYIAGGCDNGVRFYRLSYVFRHELGHWVEFFHGYNPLVTSQKPAFDISSITYPNYWCTAWDNFNSHDASSLSAIYGN